MSGTYKGASAWGGWTGVVGWSAGGRLNPLLGLSGL